MKFTCSDDPCEFLEVEEPSPGDDSLTLNMDDGDEWFIDIHLNRTQVDALRDILDEYADKMVYPTRSYRLVIVQAGRCFYSDPFSSSEHPVNIMSIEKTRISNISSLEVENEAGIWERAL